MRTWWRRRFQMAPTKRYEFECEKKRDYWEAMYHANIARLGSENERAAEYYRRKTERLEREIKHQEGVIAALQERISSTVTS